MYFVREFTKQQLLAVYRENINGHFPPDEAKPIESIERMLDMDCYFGLGMFETENTDSMVSSEEAAVQMADDTAGGWKENAALIGYAFFIQDKEENVLLLDYFAILEQHRSGGFGSIFLKEMKEKLGAYRGILLETEDIAFAENEQERKVRERRDRFYERNGIIKTEVRSKLFGVNYAIWSYSFGEELSEEACRRGLTNLYKIIVPEAEYEKYAKIW